MRHYKREYTNWNAVPRFLRGKWVWRAEVDEYVITEATDERGQIIVKNGQAQLAKKRHQRTHRLSVPCEPDASYKCGFTGSQAANVALEKWRTAMLEQADRDYEAAVANDSKGSRSFSYEMMPFSKFMDLYLNERKADGIERSTMDGYRKSAKAAKEYFGNMLVGDIHKEQIIAYSEHLIDIGNGETTRRKKLLIIKMAFRAHEEHISDDPFHGFRMPSAKEPDPNILDDKSLKTLKKAIKKSNYDPFMTAVEIAIRTGMRQGEICGLRWGDVDLETGTITVCNAIGRTDGGTTTYTKNPKNTRKHNANVERTIPGTPKLKSMFLARRRVMAQELKASLGETGVLRKQDLDLVTPDMYVTGTFDGRYMNPGVLGRTWRGYATNLMGTRGRRPCFHDLRHTFATISLAGVHNYRELKSLASILGHSVDVLMKTYAAVLDEDKTYLMETMESKL